MARNGIVKSGGSKAAATIVTGFIMLPFFVVAFFKISELTLVPFLAKLRRNRFLDTMKKTQTNDTKVDPLEVLLKSSHAKYEDLQTQEKKTLSIDDITNKKPLSSDEILS